MGRITIADIARHAGVSTAAVSYALNGRPGVSDTTREQVLAIAAELGWAPSSAARSLSGAYTETVGLVLARAPETLGFESFYMQFVAGIESVLSERDFGLLLQVAPDIDAELRTYRKWRAARRVDGVVMVDPRVPDPRLDLLLAPDALPAVVVGDPSLSGGLTSVYTDDATAMASCVEYLAGLGHTVVGHVTGTPEFGHTHIREEAFTREAAARSVTAEVRHADYTPDAGAAATRDLLSHGGVTAIVYDNDAMALAGLGAAHEAGVRVPEDVSLVAWDDSPVCRAAYPQLTALSHDVASYGAHVARRLFERMAGEPPASYRDSTPQLRVRGSTAPPALSLIHI
ncbi:LacI family DNA-binding transcriptional regulator [Myceligenerans indicum]|uniref:LacI family transcriptional regulator n=1 Tax=Myceligenerans indicum TaxID=2593663 RepID=A0ABS1LIX7_9MICO|nr:LacI family DNA-binding transcriptional regulator [Myceligenerans indicum]MBL0885783.1 LacI family transcriptional regulator [Myceligenerans indicum]